MPLKVIVVGAGVGGPAVASALARNGHSVTIYERAQSTTDVGYAFRITANSDRCLRYLGIDTVAGGATPASASRQMDEDGNVLFEFSENKDKEIAKRGTSVFVSRPQIARQLNDAALSLGVVIKTGVKVERVDSDKTIVVLEDGTEVAADLIIGADGIHSVVRSSVVDTTMHKPQPTLKSNAFRFSIPQSVIREDEVLSKVIASGFQLVSWKGEEKRILGYAVDFDTTFSVTCHHPAHLSDDAALLQDTADGGSATAVAYNRKVPIEKVHEIYSEFEPRLHRLFDKADPDGFRIWKLQDLEELPQWSANRTLLIGDAAHAVLPFAFSGASMTIEDAIVLGELLPSDVKVEDIPARLQVLEEVRKPRLKHVKSMGVKIGKGGDTGVTIPEYMQWLGQYDAVEVGKEALRKQLGQ